MKILSLNPYLSVNQHSDSRRINFEAGKAIYAGSFDPITNGHYDLIKEASKLYDELIYTFFNQ